MKSGFIGQGIGTANDSATRFVSDPADYSNKISKVGTVVFESITDDRFAEGHILTAFAQESGVEQLSKVLSNADDIEIKIIVGIDHKNTPVDALNSLVSLPAMVRIFNRNSITYHPKIYYFSGPQVKRSIVGSSNLTKSGLNQNVEAAMIAEATEDGRETMEDVSSFVDQIWKVSQPLTEDLIEALEDDGQITKAGKQNSSQSYTRSSSDDNNQPDILASLDAKTPIQGLSPAVPSGPDTNATEDEPVAESSSLPSRSEMPSIKTINNFDTKTDRDYYSQLVNDGENQPSLIRRCIRAHGEVAKSELEEIASKEWNYSLSGSFGASIHVLTDVVEEVRREVRDGETYFIWSGE